MKYMPVFLIFILNILLFTNATYGQQYVLKGRVVNKDKEPVEFVLANLLKHDSVVAIRSSDSKGVFSFAVEKGNYRLILEQFGTEYFNRALLLGKDLDIGEITVNESVVLEGVTITGRKKLIEHKVDRMVFNVENSIVSQGMNGLDVLRNTPLIRIQNDNVSIIGKGGVAIMIDDRMLNLSGSELTSYLQSLQSNDIAKIEVITTPPSKYESQGNSGIVNIRLKKAKKNNFSGNLKNSYTQAKYLLASWGGGLNYQKNKMTVTSNINYNNGSIAPYQEYTIHYPSYEWFETNNKRRFLNSLSGRVALDYQVSPKTIMGIQYSGVFNKPLTKGKNTSYITNKNDVLDSLIITPSRLEGERKTHSLNFHSITKTDTLGTQYSVDVDYFKYKSDIDNNFSTNTYSPNNVPLPNRYISANNPSNQNIDIYTAKFDYEIPLTWFNLSFGGKVSFINNNSQVSYFDTTTMNLVFDPTKSNAFNYKENTQALYVSGNKKLSEKWDMQLGMRLEGTQTKGYSETLNQTNNNKYIKLFPTFYLTYKATENSTWGLSYSRRIDRPSYNDLNPFRFYSSKYNYAEGNPFLQPFYIDNADISFTHKNYFASLYVNYTTNGFDQVTFVSNENPVQKIIPYNFYKQIKVGITNNYTFNHWNWIESNNMLSLHYAKTTSDLSNATLPILNKLTLYFVSNNNFVLNHKKNLKAELNFTYQSPSVAGSYTTTAWYYVDMGLVYSIFNRKIQIALNVMDVFKTNKTTFTQVVNGINQKSFDYSDTQKLRLSLTWNFGKQLKTNRREQSNEDEKKRL